MSHKVELNEHLLVSQGVEDRKDAIISVHKMLHSVLANPESFTDPVKMIEEMEYTLQGLWNFPEERNWHTHWIRMKGCTCPVLDNAGWVGTPNRWINKDCPWHYKGEKNAD